MFCCLISISSLCQLLPILDEAYGDLTDQIYQVSTEPNQILGGGRLMNYTS